MHLFYILFDASRLLQMLQIGPLINHFMQSRTVDVADRGRNKFV